MHLENKGICWCYYCREGPADRVPYSVKHVKNSGLLITNNLPLQISTCLLLKIKYRVRESLNMAGRVGTATVRAVKRRLIPARAALTLTQPAVQRFTSSLSWRNIYQFPRLLDNWTVHWFWALQSNHVDAFFSPELRPWQQLNRGPLVSGLGSAPEAVMVRQIFLDTVGQI